MSLSLDEYRTKIINYILHAKSNDEVSRFIDTAINSLEHNRVNGHIIVRFVDRIIGEFDEFNPMNEDAQHWSNIRVAKILFKRIKIKLNESVN